MSVWAIIPVKSLTHGKSRLSSVLGVEERAALNRRLFGRVIETAQRAFNPDRIAVVTGDAFLLTLVRGQGLHGLDDNGAGLNAALAVGCRYAARHSANAVVVLPSDLPLITVEDVRALTAALDDRVCVIAPDEQEQGTNALALTPPDPDFFRFGAESFQAHLEAARTRGLRPRILRRPGLAHDLDTPESYRRYARGELAGATA
jgi:2-phospho-L-lactate guanylyltransferase